jgi:hypothetical protein
VDDLEEIELDPRTYRLLHQAINVISVEADRANEAEVRPFRGTFGEE